MLLVALIEKAMHLCMQHMLKLKETKKAQQGMKYVKHSENEGQEKGWLTCIHYEGREVWVKWHPVS